MPVTDKEQNGIVIWQSVEGGETISTGKTILLTMGMYIEPERKENISDNINRNNTNRQSKVYPWDEDSEIIREVILERMKTH